MNDEYRDDEKLLQDIARLARDNEDGENDARLRRLTRGELSPQEEAELRTAAEESDDARRDIETFRPLGEHFEARMVRAWQERTGGAEDLVPRTRGTAIPQRPSSAKFPSGRPRDWRIPPPSLAWVAAAAVLALAVVGFLLFRAPAFDLPVYAPELQGARQTVRSPDAPPDTSAPPTFDLGSTFRLFLTPENEVAERPELTFFLAGEDGELRPWAVTTTRTPDGVVKVEGILGEDLEITPGDWTLVVLYGRPGRLPKPETLSDLDDGGRSWDAVRLPFRIVAGVAGEELPLEVLYAGCAAVLRGPVCVPYDALTFWVRSAPRAEIEIRVEGEAVAVRGEAVDGGQRFTVPVEATQDEVEIVASSAGREASFRLRLSGSDLPSWLWSAQAKAYEGDVAAAREILEDKLPGTDVDPEFRGVASSLLARLGGTEAERIERLEEAIELHRESGRWLELADDLAMLASLDMRHRHFAGLRQRLDILADLPLHRLPGDVSFHLFYYRGILESDVANFRDALGALESAARIARRLGLVKGQALADGKLGFVLHHLGRHEEALGRFHGLETSALRPCQASRLHNNHAWILMTGDGGTQEDPLLLLERSLGLAEGRECGQDLALDLRLNQALALIRAGRAGEARQALAEADVFHTDASALHRLWWEDVEGRLAFAAGRPAEALEHYRRMEALAADAFAPGGRWWAKVRQAAAHEHLGEIDAALDALGEAGSILDDQSLQVPLDAGRERFVAERDAGVRRHLELLLDADRVAEALDVARRSRSRVLEGVRRGHRLAHLSAGEQATWDLEISRYLDLRDAIEADAAEDWRLSKARRDVARVRRAERRGEARRALDRAFQVFGGEATRTTLPQFHPGELVLAYHPLPEGWVGFAARPAGIDVHRFELPAGVLDDPRALAERLLEPFRDAVEAAERLRVLAYGDLQAVDVHALPWNGEVLLTAKAVVYGLDLERRPPGAGRDVRRALVVGDPRGDLPAARHEAEAVADALEKREEVDVVRLEGLAATLPELRRHVETVDLLHIAGHGVAAGRFGWESGLLLAGNGRLTLGDILALGRAPAEVVLSSCESARGAGTEVAGLGLAQAFLVAGSERVIAALRPVGDRDTAVLFRRLYASSGSSSGLAARLRRAQLAWRESDPAADWASFRVLEP